MYDKELACHILKQVLQSSKTIRIRFEPVQTVDDFTNSFGGLETVVLDTPQGGTEKSP